ncbi:recombinase family protein [Streptosporangium roseum]|uniref:recombinase family protein n=1 Tax=Streptosporangium roseum TaxID=2001 RepID=UPI00331D039C
MDGQRRVGCARCSTNEQGVIVQTEQLRALGVEPERISIDRGFSGTTRTNRAGRSCRHPPFRCRWMR